VFCPGVHRRGSVHRLSGCQVVPQTLRPTDHGEAAVQVLAHGDAEPGARPTARLRRDLEDLAPETDGVVARHHAFLFVTQNRIEIDGPERHEGAGGVTGHARKRRVVLRHKVREDRLAAGMVLMPATRNSFTRRS
jgi:hypothetical protein